MPDFYTFTNVYGNKMAVTAVLSVALLLAGLASANPPSRDCYVTLNSCVVQLASKYDSHRLHTPSDVISFAQTLDVDEVCGDLEVAQHCIQQALDNECAGLEVFQAEAVVSMVAYSCSPGGRNVLRAVKFSPCLNDVTMMLSMMDRVEQCQLAFNHNLYPIMMEAYYNGTEGELVICPLYEQRTQCVITASDDVCGSAVASYVSGLWTRVRGVLDFPFSDRNCFTDSPAKRSLNGESLKGWFKF